MSDRKIDFGELALVQWVVGVGLVILSIATLSGLAALSNIALPGFVVPALGAAIGVAAWFSYLLKRNS